MARHGPFRAKRVLFVQLLRALILLLLVGVALAAASGVVPVLLSDPTRIAHNMYALLAGLVVPSLAMIAAIIGTLLIFWRPIEAALKHRPALLLGLSTFVVILGVTGVAVWEADHQSYEHLADRIAADTLVVTSGVLVLGVAAGVFGVLAYAEAVLRPHFRGDLWFLKSDGSRALSRELLEDTSRPTQGDEQIALKPVTVDIVITNDGQADAANVIIVVDFPGMLFEGRVARNSEDFAFVPHTDLSSPGTRLQWESRADPLIYQRNSRRLTFSLSELRAVRSESIMINMTVFGERATPLRQSYRVWIERAAPLALAGSGST